MSAIGDGSLACLLIEDNPNDARLIRRYLRETTSPLLPERIDVHHEEALDPGIEALEERDVDLLLLDLGLPESRGTATFERVVNRTEDVPIVVLTGLEDEEAAVDLLQRGAQDYLNKGSIDEERLVKSIRYALERQEREEELRATSQQLEVLNRILRHDIRNDLQVLRGWTETLRERLTEEGGGEERRRELEALDHIERTSEHIVELTENGKTYMRLVAGDEGEVDLEPVRLDEVLREEVRKARSTYPDAEFVLEEPPEVVVNANGMLASVFRNLLNNAVQHNDSETPRVWVAIEREGGEAIVTVADDGPGVPDEQKEDAFGKGERGLESEGTGIGLYLVNAIVSEFGGDVWIEDRTDLGDDPGSEDGRAGAAFRIALETASTGSV